MTTGAGLAQRHSWMDASEDKFYAVSRRRCDVPSNWSQTELLPFDQDINDHTFGGYEYNDEWLKKFFDRVGQTPPDVDFRASSNFGCDPHAKALNENYFQYYPDGSAREGILRRVHSEDRGDQDRRPVRLSFHEGKR